MFLCVQLRNHLRDQGSRRSFIRSDESVSSIKQKLFKSFELNEGGVSTAAVVGAPLILEQLLKVGKDGISLVAHCFILNAESVPLNRVALTRQDTVLVAMPPLRTTHAILEPQAPLDFVGIVTLRFAVK